MIVKVRVGTGPKLSSVSHEYHVAKQTRRLALVTSMVMTPASLLAFALGSWRMAADLNWTDRFVIANGAFSHWQVWIAIAFLLQVAASLLSRYSENDRTR